MKLGFRTITIENFKSFTSKQTLAFDELPIGLCFLRGENDVDVDLESNGSGKSSIWDALSWCLYGKTPDGLRNPDLMPWGTKAKTTVTLELDVDDGESISIRRCANPNSLRLNGKDIGSEEVERLIGINYSTFTNTILLGQGQDLFFDLGPADKLSLFSDALDLQRWDDRASKASEKCRVLETQRDDVDRDLVAGTSKLDQIKGLLKDVSTKADSWTDETQKRMDVLEVALEKDRKLLESAKVKKVSAEVVEDGALTEKDALEKSWKPAYDTLFELRDELAALESTKKAKQSKLKELKADLSGLKKSPNCPTCGQPVEKKNLAKHTQELEHRISKLEDVLEEIDVGAARDKYVEQEKVIERLRPQFDEKAETAKKARSEVNMWSERLRELSVSVTTKERELKDLQNAVNPYSDQLRKMKKEREVLVKVVEESKEELAKLDRRIARVKYWVRGFKDVRLYIMHEVLAELQMATNSMLDSVGLRDWRVEYDVEQETKAGTVKRGLSVMIYSPMNDKPVRWESWSGGEGQRLRLVGAMALSEVLLSYAGVDTNLEIFDEPNRGLSPGGIQDLCEFLRDRSKALGRQVWYTDQQSPQSSLFSAVITVTKTADQGSRISVA